MYRCTGTYHFLIRAREKNTVIILCCQKCRDADTEGIYNTIIIDLDIFIRMKLLH